MKNYCYIIILLFASTCPLFGQSLNDGMYNENWENERDAINNSNQERQRWQEDYYYQQLMKQQQQRNTETERKVREATTRAQQGIQFSTDNSTVRTPSSYASKQKAQAQMKKAQREAEHQQWLAQKRAAQAAAAERERQRIERERIEQQRRYNEALANEYRSSAAHYNRLHNEVDYKATEGFERMIYTQPEGTERMQSGYMPSSTHIQKADIQSVVSKHSSGKTVSLTLSGNEHISPSEWNSPDLNPTPKLPPMKPYFQLSEEDTSDIVGYEIKPIADGCGAAGDKLSHELALIGSQIEASHIKEINGIRYYSIIPLPYTDEDVKAMEKYCYPHDLEYYYGRTWADKRKADIKLAKGAPVKGIAVMMSTQSIVAFINARKANEMSRYLQHKYNVDVEYGMYLAPVKSKKK